MQYPQNDLALYSILVVSFYPGVVHIGQMPGVEFQQKQRLYFHFDWRTQQVPEECKHLICLYV